jgi:hypothetical protein
MHLAICLLRADYCRLVVQAQLMRHPLGVEMFDIEVRPLLYAPERPRGRTAEQRDELAASSVMNSRRFN